MTPQKLSTKSSQPRSRTPAKASQPKSANARTPKPRSTKSSPAESSDKPADQERRGLGPTGELSSEVMEFITAIDEYKRNRRRPFPNWSEIFEIVKALGYNKSA